MDKKAFTIKELLFVIGVFIVMIAVLGPFVRMAKVRANRVECANNLRRISLGIHGYEADHNGAFPETLGVLYPDYIQEESAFDCPAGKSVGTKEKPDYVYIKGVTELSPPKTVLVEDADGNHGKRSKNVLRLDGAVDWVSGRR